MSWQNEMTRILRYLIDDFVEPYTYTDDRLEEVLVIGAQLINYEVDWEKDYVTDVDAISITPDPTDATRDNAFINLASLKAACVLLSAEAKAQGACAVKVQDGPSTIDMSKSFDALQKRAQQACKDYQLAKVEYQAGNSRAGEAIIGPYTVDNRVDIYPGNFN